MNRPLIRQLMLLWLLASWDAAAVSQGDSHHLKVLLAKSQIQQLGAMATLYRLDHGKYPSQEQGIDELLKVNKQDGPRRDPWGNYYQYRVPGLNNSDGVDIWSYGADGKAGGSGADEDVGNWPDEQDLAREKQALEHFTGPQPSGNIGVVYLHSGTASIEYIDDKIVPIELWEARMLQLMPGRHSFTVAVRDTTGAGKPESLYVIAVEVKAAMAYLPMLEDGTSPPISACIAEDGREAISIDGRSIAGTPSYHIQSATAHIYCASAVPTAAYQKEHGDFVHALFSTQPR